MGLFPKNLMNASSSQQKSVTSMSHVLLKGQKGGEDAVKPRDRSVSRSLITDVFIGSPTKRKFAQTDNKVQSSSEKSKRSRIQFLKINVDSDGGNVVHSPE